MTFDMESLRWKAKEIGINLSDLQFNQFFTYYVMMMEKNQVMNLTAITEMQEVIDKHFMDSIMLKKVIDLDKIETVADMGTGAGFPGIPLKIVFPHLQITLMDSLNKRLQFLDDVIAELGLIGIETLHGRAEDIGKDLLYRENYDLCVSRAVANLSTLSEYCLPVVKKGGQFISYKSGDVAEELDASKKAISILGGEIKKVEYFKLPQTDLERSFVVIDKIKETPKKYPRKAGTPGKEPIK